MEPSVRENLAARQQSYPELGKLVLLRLQSAEQPALALLSTESESAKDCTINGSVWKYEKGSYEEAKPGEPAYSQLLVPRCSVFRMCSSPVTKE